MTTPTLEDLLPTASATEIFDFMIDLATELGLPTTSWEEGDVTLTEYHNHADLSAARDRTLQKYIAGGYLDLIAGLARDGVPGAYSWLVLLAEQMYGYTADEATFASTFVTFENTGSKFFGELAAGDVTVRSSTSGKTYQITNETPFTIESGPGFTIGDIPVTADEPGSDSSAAAGEIDELVTGLIGVTVTNPSFAVGTDAESIDSIVRGCRARLGILTDNDGKPADGYDSVALDKDKTGTTAVTRSRTFGESETGDVLQYIAGPGGELSSEIVAQVEEAVVSEVVPLALATYTLESAQNLVQPVTYRLWLYETVGLDEGEVKQLVENGLLEWFRERPIGGDTRAADDTGKIFQTSIEGAIQALFERQDFLKVDVLSPAFDVPVLANQVPVKGVVTASGITFEKAPTG
jgi:hypothetical protein